MTTPVFTVTHNAADDDFNVFNTIHEMIFWESGHRAVDTFFDHLALILAEDGKEMPLRLLINIQVVTLPTAIYWLDRMTRWQQQNQAAHCTVALVCDAPLMHTLVHAPVLNLLPAYADNALQLFYTDQRDAAFDWLFGVWQSQYSVA